MRSGQVRHDESPSDTLYACRHPQQLNPEKWSGKLDPPAAAFLGHAFFSTGRAGTGGARAAFGASWPAAVQQAAGCRGPETERHAGVRPISPGARDGSVGIENAGSVVPARAGNGVRVFATKRLPQRAPMYDQTDGPAGRRRAGRYRSRTVTETTA